MIITEADVAATRIVLDRPCALIGHSFLSAQGRPAGAGEASACKSTQLGGSASVH